MWTRYRPAGAYFLGLPVALPAALPKLALTVWFALIVIVHVELVPLQAPPQPTKLAREPAAAVSVTVGDVLLAYSTVQEDEHVLAGVLTDTDPLPLMFTVSRLVGSTTVTLWLAEPLFVEAELAAEPVTV